MTSSIIKKLDKTDESDPLFGSKDYKNNNNSNPTTSNIRVPKMFSSFADTIAIMRNYPCPWHAYIPVFLNIFTYGISANPIQQFINMYICGQLHPELVDPTHLVGNIALPHFSSCTKASGVQSSVTLFTQQLSLLTAIPAIIMTPLIGMQSDRFGRRKIIFIPLICSSLSSLSFILVTTFNVGVQLLYVVHAIQGLMGSYNIAMMCLLAYLADITKQDERSRVFSIFEIMVLTAFTLGPFFGGLMTEIWKIEQVFYITLFCKILLIAWTFFFFPESFEPLRKNPPLSQLQDEAKKELDDEELAKIKKSNVIPLFENANESIGEASGSDIARLDTSQFSIKSSVKSNRKRSFGGNTYAEVSAFEEDNLNVNSIFSDAPASLSAINSSYNSECEDDADDVDNKDNQPTKRRLPKFKDFLMLFDSPLRYLSTILLFIANFSISATAVSFQFVMYRYGWNSYAYGIYCLVASAVNALCLWFTPKKWAPQYMLVVAFTFFILEYVTRGFAEKPALMYMSGILGGPAVLSKPMVRTILSKSVDSNLQGVLLSAAQTIEGLSVVCGNILLPYIYRTFVEKDLPGIVWFVLSSLDVVGIILAVVLVFHIKNLNNKEKNIVEEANS